MNQIINISNKNHYLNPTTPYNFFQQNELTLKKKKKTTTGEISEVIIAPFLLRKMQIMGTPTSNKVQIQKIFVKVQNCQ